MTTTGLTPDPRRSSSSPGCRAPGRRPRRSCSRTSASPSSTTCRASCCPTSRSSSSSDRDRFRAGRHRPRRAGRRRAPGARGDARRARGPGHRPRSSVPRGERRVAHPALLARRAIAIRSATAAASPAPIAEERRLLDADPRTRPTSSSTPRTCRCGELRERLFSQLGDGPRAGPPRHPAHQLRLQVRHPARGRPRLRRAVHGEPVLRARAAPDLRA